MNGLELAEKYYREEGRPMIEAQLPEAIPYLAAGLSGDGSDCLGFDDTVSRDHDFGPGFCIWLTEDGYKKYGQALQKLYLELPGLYEGFPARIEDPHSGKRVGVFEINDFYRTFLGDGLIPATDDQWLRLPEDRLAAATSGKVFEDNAGEFTALRNRLLAYYPERVRLEKMAQALHLIAQTGQYNYARCMRRGDVMGAGITIHEFLRQVIHLIHLIDRRYEPYYKWAWKSFTLLPSAEGLVRPLQKLMELKSDPDAWLNYYGQGLNLKDERVLLIESVCKKILTLLKREGLAAGDEAFLDVHAGRIFPDKETR